MKKIITTLIIIVLANALFIGLVFAESTKGTVTASELNFRESANTNANAIDVLYKGARVNIISEEGDWYKVKYNNEEGYVSKQYISKDRETNNTNTSNTSTNTQTNTLANTATPTNNTTVTTPTPSGMETPSDIIELNKTKIKSETTLYVLPLINATKLANLNVNASVQLVSINGDWAYVQTENNSGWVIKKTLEKATITLASSTSSTGESNESQGSSTTNEITASANTVENTTSNSTINETTTTPTPTATPTNSEYPTTMYVKVEAVNVRSKANTSSEVVTSVGKNVPITVEAKEGDWYKVKTSDGNGYIRSDLLSKTK